jgi:CBS domain containing-hemolysin-like protein
MKKLAQDGNRKAKRVMAISERYDTFISTVLIGNNIVNILLSSLATLLFVDWLKNSNFASLAAGISTAVVTVVVLIFGEISPKTIAKDNADGFAMGVCDLIRFLEIIFAPFNFIFGLWKKLLNVVFHKSEEASITEEELITIVDEAEEDGGIDPDEGKLIRSAIEFNDVTVNEILTPRVDICAIERTSTNDEIADTFMNSSFSRLPVYEDDLDHIVGVLHEKDFYSARRRTNLPLDKIYKKPVYVSEHTKISDLLQTLKSAQCHMAVVVDEFGGTKGIVTMEDIIEELIGDVFDEHDEILEEYHELEDGSYLVLCSANLGDFFEKFEVENRDEENLPQTLNGWVMMMLESLPDVGDVFVHNNLHIEVTRISEKRVEEVHVTVLESSSENDEESK